jgi:DNA-binding Lrp family transcriptional regulator
MVAAFVLVNCHFPFDIRIMHEISKLPSVTSVYRTEGRYDLLVNVKAETEHKLKELITTNIDTIRGVDSTLSLTIS